MNAIHIGEVLTAGAAFVGTLLIDVACATPAVAAPAMSRATVEPGVELEYRVQGSGEPVVLLHAGMFADWFRPLLDEAALTARYRVLSLHRVGYAGSSRVAGSVSIARQASQVRELMRQLGMTRAHIVGHSSGANIALQLALDASHQVHSLALLEPALPVGSTAERMLSTRQSAMALITDNWRNGDKAGAMDGFMRMVAGPAYRAAFDRALPGAFERGLADADTFFNQELPAIQQWQLTPEDARAHQAARARRDGRQQSGGIADLEGAPATDAELAAQRRELRAAGRDASAARATSSRDGRGAGCLLRAPSDRRRALTPAGLVQSRHQAGAPAGGAALTGVSP